MQQLDAGGVTQLKNMVGEIEDLENAIATMKGVLNKLGLWLVALYNSGECVVFEDLCEGLCPNINII